MFTKEKNTLHCLSRHKGQVLEMSNSWLLHVWSMQEVLTIQEPVSIPEESTLLVLPETKLNYATSQPWANLGIGAMPQNMLIKNCYICQSDETWLQLFIKKI